MPYLGTRFGRSAPLTDEAPTFAADMKKIVDQHDDCPPHTSGAFASRPTSSLVSPGKTGRKYTATDRGTNGIEYTDQGTSWARISPPEAGEITNGMLADPVGVWVPLGIGPGVAVLGSVTPSSRLEPGGIVRLKGALQAMSTSLPSGMPMATLTPTTHRPVIAPYEITVAMHNSTGPAFTSLLVPTTGVLVIGTALAPAKSFGLDGVTFTLS